jgi:hypothetical protein
VEGEFSEVRLKSILGSRVTTVAAKIAHLSGFPKKGEILFKKGKILFVSPTRAVG